MEAARSGDDLECLRATSLDIARDRPRPHQERHEHAARADRGENVGHVRGLAAIAHIGLADRELAKFDICELHGWALLRSEEHTSELQSLMRISYAVFCLKTTKKRTHVYSRQHITR